MQGPHGKKSRPWILIRNYFRLQFVSFERRNKEGGGGVAGGRQAGRRERRSVVSVREAIQAQQQDTKVWGLFYLIKLSFIRGQRQGSHELGIVDGACPIRIEVGMDILNILLVDSDADVVKAFY